MCTAVDPRDYITLPDGTERRQPLELTSGQKPAKRPSLLIAEHDTSGRPIGIGGKRRDVDIMDVVDRAQ